MRAGWLLTFHESDGGVGLFTGAGLAHIVDGLHHEGVDRVGLESLHTDPGEGTVGVERTNGRHPELGRVLLVDPLGADGDDVVSDGAWRVIAGPGTAPGQRDAPAGEARHQGPGGGVGWGCNKTEDRERSEIRVIETFSESYYYN